MPLPRARFQYGETYTAPISKVVCVGRNYAEHAAELDNPVPTQPLLFIKPPSAVTVLENHITMPATAEPVHYETELALLIGSPLTHASDSEADEAIIGLGLALDLTLRETQSQLKKNGHPWEIAKAFDGACPLSEFVPREQFPATWRLHFSLHINGEARQHGNMADMLKPIPALVSYMSKHFTLEPGDVVLTGTPAGVGQLAPGDRLSLTLEDRLSIETTVS
ncbi:isomerase/hydrolase [Halovibrio salipaludis]|uniref:Isomerase/hydrolase n=1 Tax=Halovibrio salipaludis TaxID=2032626 RepID=A0A2A2EZQ5_9GAMM|nr:fumarylacetoacetate hydrolase family protein [Halovibrio salipaludis]PAU77793.1 isomerase/hydrolase [Halovibrio salipaludis]